jgi:hypothetical protein
VDNSRINRPIPAQLERGLPTGPGQTFWVQSRQLLRQGDAGHEAQWEQWFAGLMQLTAQDLAALQRREDTRRILSNLQTAAETARRVRQAADGDTEGLTPWQAEWCRLWRDEPTGGREIRIPVVALSGDRSKEVTLHLWQVPGPPEIHCLPAYSLAPYGPELHEGMSALAACSRLGLAGTVFWAVTARGLTAPHVDGRSFTGAAAVGIRLLQRKEAADPQCAVVGRYEPEVGWGPLETDQAKGEHWLKGAAERRVIVARRPGEAEGKRWVECPTLDEAVEQASAAKGLRDYLKWIVEQTKMVGSGVDREDVRGRMPLESAYVSLSASYYVAAEHVAREAKTQREIEKGGYSERGENQTSWGAPQSLESIMAGQALALILGDPGCGKTTLCRYAALVHARTILESGLGQAVPCRSGESGMGESRIPVLVRLSAFEDWQRHQRLGLSEYIRQCVSFELVTNRLAMDPRRWAELYETQEKEGRVLFLFDGLDEIADVPRRIGVRDQLEEFLREHVGKGRNRAIVTSRIAGYGQAALAVNGLAEFRVRPMAEDQVEAFLKAWATAAGEEGLHARLTEEIVVAGRRGLEALRETPLLLHMVAGEVKSSGKLPNTRVELYDSVVRRAIGRRMRDSLELVMAVLADVGLLMQRDYSAGTMEWKQFRAAVGKSLAHRFREHHAEDMAKDLLKQSGLLHERGEGRVAFVHLTFQEFFAGLCLMIHHTGGLYSPAQAEVQPVYDLLGDPRWAVATGFALTMPLVLGWPDRRYEDFLLGLLRLDQNFPAAYLKLASNLSDLGKHRPELSNLLFQRSLTILELGAGSGLAKSARRVLRALIDAEPRCFMALATAEFRRGGASAVALAQQLPELGFAAQDLVVSLAAAAPRDTEATRWPYQRALQRMLSEAERGRLLGSRSAVNAVSLPLPLVRAGTTHPRWLEFVRNHDKIQRFLMAVYGGLADFGFGTLLAERARLYVRFHDGAAAAKEELEKRVEPARAELEVAAPEFRWEWITRDSLLSPHVQALFEDGASEWQWLQQLEELWKKSLTQRADPRGRELLIDLAIGLTACGESERLGALPADLTAAVRERLNGTLEMLRDAYLRAIPAGRAMGFASTNALLGQLAGLGSDPDEGAAIVESLLTVQRRMGGPPIDTCGLPGDKDGIRWRLPAWEWSTRNYPTTTDPRMGTARLLDDNLNQLAPSGDFLAQVLAHRSDDPESPEPLEADLPFAAAEALVDLLNREELLFVGIFPRLWEELNTDPEWRALLLATWRFARRRDSAISKDALADTAVWDEAASSERLPDWPQTAGSPIAEYRRARFRQFCATHELRPQTQAALVQDITDLWRLLLPSGVRTGIVVPTLYSLAALLDAWEPRFGKDLLRMGMEVVWHNPYDEIQRPGLWAAFRGEKVAFWQLLVPAFQKAGDSWWVARQLRRLRLRLAAVPEAMRSIEEITRDWDPRKAAWANRFDGKVLDGMDSLPAVVRVCANLLDMQDRLREPGRRLAPQKDGWSATAETADPVLGAGAGYGVVLDAAGIVTIRRKWQKGQHDEVLGVLRQCTEVEPQSLPALRACWGELSGPARRLAGLWLLEAGDWNPERAQGAFELFESGDERERLLAALVLTASTGVHTLDRSHELDIAQVGEPAVEFLWDVLRSAPGMAWSRRTRQVASWSLSRLCLDGPEAALRLFDLDAPWLCRLSRISLGAWVFLERVLARESSPASGVKLAVRILSQMAERGGRKGCLFAGDVCFSLSARIDAGSEVKEAIKAIGYLAEPEQDVPGLMALREPCQAAGEAAEVEFWRAVGRMGYRGAKFEEWPPLADDAGPAVRRARLAARLRCFPDAVQSSEFEDWELMLEWIVGRFTTVEYFQSLEGAAKALIHGESQVVESRIRRLVEDIEKTEEQFDDPDDLLLRLLQLLSVVVIQLPEMVLQAINGRQDAWIDRMALLGEHGYTYPVRKSAGVLLGYLGICRPSTVRAWRSLFADVAIVADAAIEAVEQIQMLDAEAVEPLLDLVHSGQPATVVAMGRMTRRLARSQNLDARQRSIVPQLVTALDERRRKGTQEVVYQMPDFVHQASRQIVPVAKGPLSGQLGELLAAIYTDHQEDTR